MILLLGGTSDANTIADRLKDLGIAFCLSITTDYGAEMANRHKEAQRKGLLTEEIFIELIEAKEITAIVDATHPHALVISELAQQIAIKCQVPYLRYERPESETIDSDWITYVNSVEEAARVAAHKGHRILLTGSKHLKTYKALLSDKQLFARVVPSPQVIEEAIQLGFQMDHIIAMKGPFTEALNKAMFEALTIDVLITKESGQAGGYKEKLAGAHGAGVHTVVIKRPSVSYLYVVHTYDEVASWIENKLGESI